MLPPLPPSPPEARRADIFLAAEGNATIAALRFHKYLGFIIATTANSKPIADVTAKAPIAQVIPART